MPSSELTPRAAARLAADVYSLNAGDATRLALFLANPLFQGNSKTMNAQVGGRVFRAARDAFGLAAVGAGDFEGDLFLVFRGTTENNNKADFVTDARIGLTRSRSGAAVHIGFNQTFNSMIGEIQRFASEQKVSGTIHCVGHSLGGAIATLAADWAHGNLSRSVKLYTFGQPRVGLSFFATNFTNKLHANNIHRVFHTTDPVPMVPIFPYVHSPLPGAGHSIVSTQKIISAEAHAIDEDGYVDSVKGKTWTQLNRSAPVFNHESIIEEWLNSHRHENFYDSKTLDLLERAIFWLVRKVLTAFVSFAQLAVMGIHTFIDMLAWALAQGIKLRDKATNFVKLFMQKVMRILGIPERIAGDNPNQGFFRFLLNTLLQRLNEWAQSAVRGIER